MKSDSLLAVVIVIHAKGVAVAVAAGRLCRLARDSDARWHWLLPGRPSNCMSALNYHDRPTDRRGRATLLGGARLPRSGARHQSSVFGKPVLNAAAAAVDDDVGDQTLQPTRAEQLKGFKPSVRPAQHPRHSIYEAGLWKAGRRTDITEREEITEEKEITESTTAAATDRDVEQVC